MSRATLRTQRLSDLCRRFDDYIAVFDGSPPFRRRDQLEMHERTIRMRRSLGGLSVALQSDGFLESLWGTLRAWGVGVRGSRLLNLAAFTAELRSHRDTLVGLEGMTLADGDHEVENQVWALLGELNVTPNKARLVATTKTLHHLLPDLVPPIDRAYTGEFFSWSPMEFQNSQEDVFRTTWRGFVEIASSTRPERLVDDTPWHTSGTKIVDNAIVGFCMEHGLSRSTKTAQRKRPVPKLVSPASLGPWTASELRDQLGEFERELREAGLRENSVQTYVGRSETFIRWLEGDYRPRGPIE